MPFPRVKPAIWAGTGNQSRFYQSIHDIYGTWDPGKDPLSDGVIANVWGQPKAGLKQQIEKGPGFGSNGLGNGSATGFGYGGRNRATIWWKDILDPAAPQKVLIDTGTFAEDRKKAFRDNPCPIPSYAFTAISPAGVHGAANSDSAMCVYDPDLNLLWEFTRMQKNLHFVQPVLDTTGTEKIEIASNSGGTLPAGNTCWRITTVNVNGESDAKPNAWDDFPVVAGQQPRISWYAFDTPNVPADGVIEYRVYRGRSKYECYYVGTIPHNPAWDGGVIQWVDDGSFANPTDIAHAVPAPFTGSAGVDPRNGQSYSYYANTATTTEWRCNFGALLHNASQSLGGYVDIPDGSGGFLERFNWGISAGKIPVGMGLIMQAEVDQFRLLLNAWRADPGNSTKQAAVQTYVLPHAIPIAAPAGTQIIRNDALYAFPAQESDGQRTQNDGLPYGARLYLDPAITRADVQAKADTLIDPVTGEAGMTVDEWTMVMVRTGQQYGFVLTDGSAGFSMYTESPAMSEERGRTSGSLGQQTGIGPNYLDQVIEAVGYTTIQAQRRRNAQVATIPFDRLRMAPLIPEGVCNDPSRACVGGGQVAVDRTFNLNGADAGDSFGGIAGEILAGHTGINTGWFKHPTTKPVTNLQNGRARVTGVPSVHVATWVPATADYEIQSDCSVFEDFTDPLPDGSIAYEHCHRLDPVLRRYIGFGYNTASSSWVIRAMTQADSNSIPVPVPLNRPRQFDLLAALLDVNGEPVNKLMRTIAEGSYAAIMWDGDVVAEANIPAGFTAKNNAGLAINAMYGGRKGIQIDGIRFFNRTAGAAPAGTVFKVFKLGDGRPAKVVLPG